MVLPVYAAEAQMVNRVGFFKEAVAATGVKHLLVTDVPVGSGKVDANQEKRRTAEALKHEEGGMKNPVMPALDSDRMELRDGELSLSLFLSSLSLFSVCLRVCVRVCCSGH